jgi:hypothetical protein
MVDVEPRTSWQVPVAGVLTAAGGALTFTASFFQWGRVSSGLGFPARLNVTVKGGGLVLALGIALAMMGVAMLFVPSRAWRLALGIVTMLVGLFVAAIGAYFALSDSPYTRTTADFVADRTNGDVDRIERILDTFVDRGALDVSRDLAVYLAVAGGAVGWAGGLVELASVRRRGAVARQPAAPGPVAGWGPVPPGGPGAQEPPPPPPAPGPAPPPEG